jgi:K+-sensing histidine kinase KdpD
VRPIGQGSLVTGIAVAAGAVAAITVPIYIFIGQPRPGRGMRRFEEALPEQLIRKLPGIDVRIVADAR